MNDAKCHTKDSLTKGIAALAYLTQSARWPREHLQHLRQQAEQLGVDVGRVFRKTDRTNLMEGLYVKVEEGGCVVERYKFVRSDFLAAVTRTGGHWLSRPIIPNLLSDGVDLFADDSA